jgi:hypothetical protein
MGVVMTKSGLAFSLGSSCLLAAGFLLSGVAQAADVSRTVLDDGTVVALFNPSAATDSDGRIHIVANGMDPASPGSGSEDIYYMLVSAGGNVLIEPTALTTDGPTSHGRPQVAINSTDQAVVIFGGGGYAMTYFLVDASLDTTLDGGPLDPAAVVEGPTAVGAQTSQGHYAFALDSADIAHVVAHRSSTLYYLAFDPSDGSNFNAETGIGSIGSRRPDPAIAIDSAGNVHIVDGSCAAGGDCPPAYKMLDNQGALVIDWTQLYDASTLGPHGAHFSAFTDGDDRVHIVYGDKRNTIDNASWCNSGCSLGGTMIYTVLDPNLDLTPTTIADIRVGNEVELGNIWYGKAFRHGDKVRVYSSSKSGGNMVHTSIGLRGSNPSTPRLIEGNLQHVGWSRAYVASTGSKVIWSEGMFVPTPAGATHRLVMASASSFAGGGGGGGAPGLALLALFGLAGLARVVGRRA